MSKISRLIIASAAAAVLLTAASAAPPRLGIGPVAWAQRAAAPAPARPHAAAPRGTNGPPAAAANQPPRLPPRIPFTAAEDETAVIPGMPEARFFADDTAAFEQALPKQPGPWLALSTGGADGAFGAGFIDGLSAAGKRPDYAVVTGVSTGALMAPFVFAGPKYDEALKAVYTQTTAADIFEVGATGESFLDTWPLKDLIAKEITPALLADVAAAYKDGRRLFVVTTDLDLERSVVWNMGAIAADAGGPDGDAAVKLFRSVLLASGSIPGAFPPVLIDVESGGKRFQEMHVDGGVGGQFFVAPAQLLASDSGYRIPATALYIVINSGLQPEFAVVERSTPLILAQSVGMAVKVDLRLMLDRVYVAAQKSGIGFYVATIPADFSAPSRGAFDPKYMQALFDNGFALAQGATPFADKPPPFPGQIAKNGAAATTDPKMNEAPASSDQPPASDGAKPQHNDVAEPGASK